MRVEVEKVVRVAKDTDGEERVQWQNDPDRTAESDWG